MLTYSCSILQHRLLVRERLKTEGEGREREKTGREGGRERESGRGLVAIARRRVMVTNGKHQEG
jgi:hypothetical protein